MIDKGKAMNSINNAYNYNDLSGLNAITKQGETDKSGALMEVARQYESMFVGMMLKSMREANAVFEEDNPLFSNESKFYREMFDDQLVLSLSKGKGMGLADTLYRQLKEQFDKESKEKPTDASLDTPAHDVALSGQPNPFSFKAPASVKATSDTLTEIQSPANLSLVKPIAATTEKVQEKVETVPVNSELLNHSKPKLQAPNKEEAMPVIKVSGFDNPQQFVSTLWPIAQKVADEMGVEPKAIMAQAALETGWGKHIIHQSNGENSHNLFGIKADRRWDGQVANVSTLEYRNGLAKKEVAPFRVYDSYESSLKDYGQFVKGSSRYKNAVDNGSSVKGYSEGLQNGGYATDPNYAKKIQRIASGDVLNQAITDIKRG